MARILIIDDDAELADQTAERIRPSGYEVNTVNSADEVFHKIAEFQPELILLDVMFPDNPVFGFDMARRIRRNPAYKLLPIILLTGVNQHFPMDFSGKDIDPNWMPVQDFMEKPANIPALLKRIERLLQKA